MNDTVTKEELTKIIDSLHLQIVWIRMCFDIAEYLQDIDKEKLKNAKNFWYLTKTSLGYRGLMELVKLFDEEDCLSIKRIRNMCSRNSQLFNDSSVVECCRNFGKELNKLSAISTKLYNRRNKSLAHNDKDYYFYNKESVDDFHLEFDEVKKLSLAIYNFAVTMQKKIDSPRKNLEYPAFSDDVKRLFGEKTEADVWLESEC